MTSALAKYEAFLIQNASTISTIESSLRSLTWFLPGRFKDAELASEALNTTLNLLNLYHDTILLRRFNQAGTKLKPVIPPSLHTRYTRAWADKDATYKQAARALEVLRFVELVIEMGLRRKVGRKGRWRGVIAVELLKAALRLVLLKITRRPLLLPPIPERELDPSALPPTAAELAAVSDDQNDPTGSTPFHLHNNRIDFEEPNPLLTVPPPLKTSSSPVDDYLLPKALSPASVRPPIYLIRPLSTPKDWLAEGLFILRPLIYVIILANNDETSSRPVTTSIALDLITSYLRRRPPPSSSLERAEYARRDRDMLWYFFRGAIWQSFTRPKLEAFADKTTTAPILGLVSGFVRDWIPLIDEYYYYTAT